MLRRKAQNSIQRVNIDSSIKANQKSPTKKEDIDKLERYFDKQEEILIQKIRIYEKKLKEKSDELKVLESFSNPMNQIFSNKVKDYQINQMNSKISNKEVFFGNEENKSSHQRSRSISLNENSLSKNDKKEILKSFLEDMEVKRFIYDLLYDNN